MEIEVFGLVYNTDRGKVKVFLSNHAEKRIAERFGVTDRHQIKQVFRRAVEGGLLSADGSDALIEHGSLVIAGNFDGDGTLTVSTVFNLCNGCSSRLRDRLWNGRPTPWTACEIAMPEEGSTDADVADAVEEEAFPPISPQAEIATPSG